MPNALRADRGRRCEEHARNVTNSSSKRGLGKSRTLPEMQAFGRSYPDQPPPCESIPKLPGRLGAIMTP
ncbi:hypothetical protein FM112_00565 [Gulosibacter sp. 10]|nr:hypothetical protein FM112_00565 [Gulosibacter sp. 10]